MHFETCLEEGKDVNWYGIYRKVSNHRGYSGGIRYLSLHAAGMVSTALTICTYNGLHTMYDIKCLKNIHFTPFPLGLNFHRNTKGCCK